MNFDTPRSRLGSATPSDGSFATATSTLEDDLSDVFSSQLNLEPQSDLEVAESSSNIATSIPDTSHGEDPPLLPEALPPLPLVTPTSEINNNDIFSNSDSSDPVKPMETPKVVEKAGLRTVVIFQDACTKHRYSRNSDIGTIVERPERIRAIKTGVAAAWARLEARNISKGGSRWAGMKKTSGEDTSLKGLDELMRGLGLDAKGKGKEVVGGPFDVLFSNAVMSVNDPALVYIHPLPNLPPETSISDPTLPAPSTSDISNPTRPSPSTPSNRSSNSTSDDLARPGPSDKSSSTPAIPASPPSSWPIQLQSLCRAASSAMLSAPYSEIPPHLPQGDLYLTEGSEEAIFGALGAVCEGVDRVVQGAGDSEGYDRAFVAIRPPGHHCAEDQPMGFCFVNNVAVAAAHAYQKHGIDRVVILDFDLHHGNGTQDIAWRINAAANQALANIASPRKGSPKKATVNKRELQVMYGSLHDVFSYPCEDGDPALVQAASLNLSGGHSQYISNVHLDSWTHEAEFHERLYPKYIEGLLGAAAAFCVKTAEGDEESEKIGRKTIVILSAGFDASEHESQGMSRHRRNVPTSFYHRFATDVSKFANTYSGGKLLSVLEGGYSDRALCSGTIAMMMGLCEAPRSSERTFVEAAGDEMSWWEEKALIRIEKACKVKKGGKLGSSNSGIFSSSASPRLLTASGPNTPTLATRDKEEEDWLARTLEIFSIIEGTEVEPTVVAPKQLDSLLSRTMQLRERRPRTTTGSSTGEDTTPSGSPAPSRTIKLKATRSVVVPTAAPQIPVEVDEPVVVKEEITPAVVPKIKFTFKAMEADGK